MEGIHLSGTPSLKQQHQQQQLTSTSSSPPSTTTTASTVPSAPASSSAAGSGNSPSAQSNSNHNNFQRLSFPRDSGCYASNENLSAVQRSSPASDRSSQSGVSSHPESGIGMAGGRLSGKGSCSSDEDGGKLDEASLLRTRVSINNFVLQISWRHLIGFQTVCVPRSKPPRPAPSAIGEQSIWTISSPSSTAAPPHLRLQPHTTPTWNLRRY